MSVGISISAFSSKDSEEFKRHFKAVQFCIENNLSYPKETSEFFKGKVGGDDLEDIEPDAIIGYIENGISISDDNFIERIDYGHYSIKVNNIPKDVDEIIVKLC